MNLKLTSGILFLLAFLAVTVFCTEEQGEDHGKNCSLEKPCKGRFTCVGGKCQCHFTDHQTYNKDIGKCVSSLLGPCVAEVDGKEWEYPCAGNMECKNITGYLECRCKEGYIEKERSCKASFGQACKSSAECYTGTTTSTGYRSLVCKNEKCDCPSMFELDKESGKCVGLVGAKCSQSNSRSCVYGAICEGYDSFNGICRCSGGNTQTMDRKCVVHQCNAGPA